MKERERFVISSRKIKQIQRFLREKVMCSSKAMGSGTAVLLTRSLWITDNAEAEPVPAL
jgi:hypothetical protein